MNLLRITPRRAGQRFVARVEIEHAGETIIAEVPLSVLASAASFRRALLASAGVWFDDHRFEGTFGREYWRSFVAGLLAIARRDELAIQEAAL